MKTIPRHLKAISHVLLSVLTAPFALAQTTPSENSSGAISVDRSAHYVQTGIGQVAAQQTPYNFAFHVRGGSESLKTNWGPKFYKPGSAGVPQSGTSTATNSGTLNFSNTPNNGSDFMFVHEFDTNAAMQSFYPIAPTDGGQYGVKFLGSSPPAVSFTDGLIYAAGTTYPAATPEIVAVDNDATWSAGKLRIKGSGITTLSLNSFSEYSSTTYGSLIAVGIYDSTTGSVVDGPSKTSYYLPVGDSTEDPDPIVQPAITEITIDGSWLVGGRTYTLEIQYAIIAGRPEEAFLNGVEFQGVSSYRRVVTISLVAAASNTSDFDADGLSDLLYRNDSSGQFASWASSAGFMNLGAEGSGWVFADLADVDGDGKDEIVWRNTSSGLVTAWCSGGGTLTLGGEGGGWTYVSTGDFDGDGKAEAAWRHTESGLFKAWCSGGGILTLGADGGGWIYSGHGDFDADGRAEIYWFNQNNGVVQTWPSAAGGGSIVLGGEGSGWIRKGVGDFDGDGKAEVYWFHTPTGMVAAWCSGGGTLTLGQEGSGWLLAGVGDYDGDGKAEPVWQHSGTKQVAAWATTDGYMDFGIPPAGWTLRQ